MFSDERTERWKKELNLAINSSNINETGSNYISQELELDAFSFTKFYLERYEGMKIIYPNDKYENIILDYIELNKSIM